MIRLRIHQSPRDALQMMTRPDERLERTDFILSRSPGEPSESVLSRGGSQPNIYIRGKYRASREKEGTA